MIEVEHEGAFITEFMHTRLRTGRFNRVPTLIGVNSEELIYLAGGTISSLLQSFPISTVNIYRH